MKSLILLAALFHLNCNAQITRCPSVFQRIEELECSKTLIWIPTKQDVNGVNELKVLAVDNQYTEDVSVQFVDDNNTHSTFEIHHSQCSEEFSIRMISYNNVVLCDTGINNEVQFENLLKITYKHRAGMRDATIVQERSVVAQNTKTKLSRQHQTRMASSHQCGKTPHTLQLIIGGTYVDDIREYPWTVAIYANRSSHYVYKCTGSIISNRHAITAAHCVKSIDASKIRIVYGLSDLSHWDEYSSYYDVDRISVHPENKGLPQHDIAILQTTNTIQFNEYVTPICLPLSSLDMTTGTVTGWGRYQVETTETSSKLRQLTMPIASYRQCVMSNTLLAQLVEGATFCAGNRTGDGPCTGDSGAGFFQPVEGAYYLLGIVSTALLKGTNCDLNNYVIFIDVQKELKWINSVLS